MVPPEVPGLPDDPESDRDGRLIVPCEGDEASADLANPDRLRAVLRRMRETPGIRGVVLVHDRERSYGPRAMAALRHLLALARLLDQFAARPPAPDFPGFAPREVEAVCARCEFHPARMFAALRDALLGGPQGFERALADRAASLAAYEEEGCRLCVAATVEELRILIGEMEREGA